MSAPEKLRLDLPLVLSGVDDAEDRCVTRLTDALSGRPGIEEAHIVGGDGDSPQLCVHYNPNEITLGRVRELVQSVGSQLGARYAHLVVRSNGPLHSLATRLEEDSFSRWGQHATTCTSDTGSSLNSYRPASMRDRSRISLMRVSR